MLEKLFRLKENNTDVRTEIIAGITTFMTMAYIIFVNPNILGTPGTGMDKGAVFVATCIGAGLVTIAMGLLVNYPIALAPGMGLNAFYTYTVILGMGVKWPVALGAVFISGLIFILLTLTKVREMIVDAIPNSLKLAITAGIGLFIALIGFKEAGMVVSNPATIIGMGHLLDPAPLVAIIGLILVVVLMVKRVKGAILIGVIVTGLLGIIPTAYPLFPVSADVVSGAKADAATKKTDVLSELKAKDFMIYEKEGKYYRGVTPIPTGIESFVSMPPSIAPTFAKLDIMGAIKLGFINIVLTFTFVELFDTLGTLVGTLGRAGLQDKKTGKFPRIGRAMLVDASGVSLGAVLGTSTITAYIESASGVAEGGRTGLTAVTTGLLFLAALFISPLAGLIPAAATAPALIVVGVLMAASLMKIDFDDLTEALPAFLVMVGMPFTFSIANGIAAGLVTYTFLKVLTGKAKEVHVIIYVLTVLFLIRGVI
jgi:adenine/guanine/hypoxanthine permease